jgi:hypothetical protein
VARGVVQIRHARFGIDGKELIDEPDNAHHPAY